MKKLTLVLLTTILLAFIYVPKISAEEKIAGGSATMSATILKADGSIISVSLEQSNNYFIKKMVIAKILEKYHSPLLSSVDAFITACVRYDLDCYLLPSIAGLESSFGLYIYPQSYNPFGWGGGYIMFKNWEEAIITVGQGLRENYINEGATNVYEIGRIYAPPSTTWAAKVEFLMKQFYNEELKLTKVNIDI